MFGFVFADKAITLLPWWNVVSTPKLLSWINFSNWWTWIVFYTLSWGYRTSIIPTIQDIKPLEWFAVNNSNAWNITMNLIYKTDVNPLETLFQRTLNLWRNILWITTITNPFTNIGSNAVMSVDFTKNGVSNLLNWINTSFTLNNVSSNVGVPELWEAYGLFVSATSTIYGGIQNTNTSEADLTFSNSTAATKTVQRGDRNVEIAKLEFGTTSDVVSKLYSFKATIGWTGYGNYDGAQVTIYNAAGESLVSSTVTSGTTTLTFVLPNYLTVSKATPVTLTAKMDQVPNAVSTGGMLLTSQFNNINAKEIINQNAVGVGLTANGSTLTSVIGGSVSVISQTYDKKLIKAGATTVIGKVNFKAFNGDAVLKTLLLSGVDVTKLSSVKLLEGGVAVATFTKTGTNLYASNINKTIAVGNTVAYDVEATFSSASTSGDLASTFTLYVETATFESPYGVALANITNTAISASNAVVNEVLTIASVDGIKGSNYASYKLGFTSAKQVQITQLVLALGQNLSTSISGATVTLSSSENAGGTVYATGTYNGGGSITLNPTAIDVITSATLYVTVQGVTWSAANGTPYVFMALSDLSYNDKFDDTSVAAHANALLNFKSAMTTISDLGKNIQ